MALTIEVAAEHLPDASGSLDDLTLDDVCITVLATPTVAGDHSMTVPLDDLNAALDGVCITIPKVAGDQSMRGPSNVLDCIDSMDWSPRVVGEPRGEQSMGDP